MPLWFILGLSDHAELTNEVKGFLHVQIKWFERRINTHIILIKSFTLSNTLQRLNGAADELRYVIYTGQYLSVRILFNKFEQLTVYDLNARNLVRVLVQDLVLAQDFVFFGNILLRKCLLELVSTLLQL